MKNSFIDESMVKLVEKELFVRSRRGKYDSFTQIVSEETLIKGAEHICEFCYGTGVDVHVFQVKEAVRECVYCDGTGKRTWVDDLIKEE
jgi:hypothetical protein